MSENRCIACNDIIPEGELVCHRCENGEVNATQPQTEIRFENTEVWGFRHAFRSMKSLCKDYHRSDTKILLCNNHPMLDIRNGELNECFKIGCSVVYVEIREDDIKFAQDLLMDKNEPWRELLRQIHVSVDTNTNPKHQMLTIDTNYEALRELYLSSEPSHYNDDYYWCKWIESLPYAKELICYKGE